MKIILIYKNHIKIILLLCFLIATACKKETTKKVEASSGYLKVEFTCTYPPWSVQSVMNVEIDSEGNIDIDPGVLQYSGEVETDETRYTRSGTWQISPVGDIERSGDETYVVVDPDIFVDNDITRLYVDGILFLEQPYSVVIDDSPVTFSYSEATANPAGSIEGVSDAGGSIIWSLKLIPSTTNCEWMAGNPFVGTWRYQDDIITSTLVFSDDMKTTATLTTDDGITVNTITENYTYSYTATTLTLSKAGDPDYITDYLINAESLTLSINWRIPWTFSKVN